MSLLCSPDRTLVTEQADTDPAELPGNPPSMQCEKKDVLPTGEDAAKPFIDTSHIIPLPQFREENLALWFLQAEAILALYRVTSDEIKYKYVVSQLNQSVLPLVSGIIANPPQENKFDALRSRIIAVYEETDESKLRRLLQGYERGDEKPTIFLQRLRNLTLGQCNDSVLKTIFMEKLPEHVRNILVLCDTEDLQRLAIQADEIMKVSQVQDMSISSLTMAQQISRIDDIIALQEQVRNLTCQLKTLTRSFQRKKRILIRKTGDRRKPYDFISKRRQLRSMGTSGPKSKPRTPLIVETVLPAKPVGTVPPTARSNSGISQPVTSGVMTQQNRTQFPHQVSAGLNESRQSSQVTALSAQTVEEWRQSFTQDLRNHFIHKFIQAILPTLDPQDQFSKQMYNLVACARKLEDDGYNKANSRSEYYHFLAENLAKVQKKLEKTPFGREHS